jgi:hypothetical protein
MIVGAQLEVNMPGLEQVTMSLSYYPMDISFVAGHSSSSIPFTTHTTNDTAGVPAWSTPGRS